MEEYRRSGGRGQLMHTAQARVYSPIMAKPLSTAEETGTTSYTYTTDTSSTATVDKAADCMSWVRYGIMLGNIVYLLVGGLLIALGVWLRTDSRFRNFLSERYRQAVEEAFWEAPTLYIFSYIMIVLGCCMIVVCFFGFCGAATRSRPLLIIYAMMVFVLMIATLASGIYLYYKRDGLDVEVSDALNYMVQHYYQGAGVVQESLDHLQMTFRCCGNAGCSDFRVFRQDPPRSCDIRCDGCHYRIMVALHIGFSVALVVFACVVLIQVLGIALVLYTVFQVKVERRVIYIANEPVPERISGRPRLTRENLKLHDLPYDLRGGKSRRKRYVH